MKFVINVYSGGQGNKIKVFDVPEEHLKDKSFGDNIEAAGWYYMNKIDFLSATGPYKWSILPLSVYEEAGFVYNGEILKV